MRKLYNMFFYVPKYGKVSESVMLARFATTIATVIVCLAAMSFTAYAYFSANISSGFNMIKSANFDAKVSITITDSNNTPVAVTKNGKLQTATLNSGTYTVELSKGESTAKTGFCIITIGGTDYYTQQIGVDVQRNLNDANVTFKLKVSSATTVKILSHWGTSSYYGYNETSNHSLYLESGDFLDLTTSTAGDENTSSTGEQSSTESTTSTNSSTTPTQGSTTSSTEATETSEPTGATEPSSTTETTQTSEPTGATEPSSTTEATTQTTESETTDTTEETQSVNETM